jgi:hypothetical protein
MGRIKFTDYVPQNLTGVNSASKTLVAEIVTGTPISTGAVVGDSFHISKAQAALLSTTYFPVYAGWYRVVQLDTGMNAAKTGFGMIGGQANLTTTLLENNVTDAGDVLNLGIAPCVFLTGGPGELVSSAYAPSPQAALTPGYFTIVQDGGDASLLVGAGQTVSVGSVLVSTAAGTVAVAGSISNTVYSTIVGIAEAAVTTPSSLTLSAVAAASGGVAVYTGTITGGGSNAFAGFQFVIAGFDLAANNSVATGPCGGAFLCTASSTTTLTLVNPLAVADTHAGTAVSQALVRARLGFPFGQQI